MNGQHNLIKRSVLPGILLLATALRLYHLDFQSLWIDEVNTMVQARPDISFIDTYNGLSMDLQPPLYFYLLKGMFSMFGYTTFVLRLFSALSGIACVWAIYRLGKTVHSEKTGIYAALLLAVNYFHIFYSQEARPYTFLCLFTIVSFNALLRFVKLPSLKTAVLYGTMSTLMLYGHAYGIITLFSQCLVLLTCVIVSRGKERWDVLRYGAFAGAITGVLYLPALRLFMTAADIQNFWIPKPGSDVFVQLLAEYFGKSELIIALVYILLTYFLYKTFGAKDSVGFVYGLKHRKPGPVFSILVIWIATGLLIPFIRSYLKVPMIVPRYMIGLLPAVILMLSIGLAYIEARALRLLVALIFLMFSVTDLVVVKDYYNRITKSQLREITSFIKQSNSAHEAVITDLWWHYAYFINKKQVEIPEMSPAEYINDIMLHPEKKKAFWYSSAHHFKFDQLPEPQKHYLAENFYIDQRLDLIEAWAIHFKPISGVPPAAIDLSAFQPINSGSGTFIFLFCDTTTKSAPVHLIPGRYSLYVNGRSEPTAPINGVNAHIGILLNEKPVGGLFLNAGAYPTSHRLRINIAAEGDYVLGVRFDNDLTLDHQDRNALIYGIRLERQQ